jgi:hypothetical protein
MIALASLQDVLGSKVGPNTLWKISLRAQMAALRRTLADDQAIAVATAEARRAARWRCREELL